MVSAFPLWRTGLLLTSIFVAWLVLQILAGHTVTSGYAGVVALWGLSGLLYVAAFVGVWHPRQLAPSTVAVRARAALRAHGAELALVGGLLLLGGILRFWALGSIPDVMSGDEGRIGNLSLNAARDGINPFTTSFGHGALYLWAMGLPLTWWGVDLGSLRLLSALAGALTVLATYLLTRAMFGVVVAALAGLLVAVNHFHLHFSRVAVAGGIMDALFATVAFWLLYRGLSANRRRDFVLSGVVMGVHLYVYMGARLVIAIALAYALLLALCDWRRAAANGGNFAALLGAVAVVGAPMAYWMWSRPEAFNARVDRVGIFQNGWIAETASSSGRGIPDLLWQQISQAFLVFNYYPAKGFYEATLPVFDSLAATTLVLGAAYVLWHLRQPRCLLLAIWVGAAVIVGGAALVSPAESAYRVLMVLPAVASLAALGAVELVRLPLRAGVYGSRVAAGSLLGFALLVGGFNVNYYFREFMTTCRYEEGLTRIASRVGSYLGTLDRGYVAYAYGAPRFYYGVHPSVDFLSRQLPVLPMDELGKPFATAVPGGLASAGGVVFLFAPEREELREQVRSRFPGGQDLELRDCGETVMQVYRLPPPGQR
jgi:4-amino-4-deoxy-L-arabinose transferase-like glycosyltransferase